MGKYTSGKALADAQKRKFGLITKAWRVQHKKTAYSLSREFLALTSGTVSSKELARRGHPFGRRRGRITLTAVNTMNGRKVKYRAHKTKSITPTPLLPINRQSGRLQRSLRIIPEGGVGLQSFRIQFTAPHAKFVLAKGGTKRMVARGFQTEMRKRFATLNRQLHYKMRLEQLQILYGT